MTANIETTLADENRNATIRRMGLVAGAIVIAILVRVAMFGHESFDYIVFFKRWYDFITANGGFGALKHSFSDYNVPYLYLIAALTYPPIPALAGIKTISVIFDLVLAFFTYRIVALRHTNRWVPSAAALVVLFLPTVATNSGLWGQADAIYAAFDVGGIYFVLRKRPWLACVFFGLALAFKLQAIFVFPLLLVLALKKWLPWRALLAVPGVVLLLDIPAWVAGAPLKQLLSIYLQQTGSYPELSLRAPSIYQFLPANSSVALFRPLGVLVTGLVVLGLILAILFHRKQLTATKIVLMATSSAILVPFLLPSMHERYFYLAEALTVVAAFYLPRRLWYVPVLLQAAIIPAYWEVLFPGGQSRGGMVMHGGPPNGQQAPPVVVGTPPPGTGQGRVVGGQDMSSLYAPTTEFRILATLMAIALIAVLWTTVREFRRDHQPA
ncbi:glycosyltransferase 87 family protein [Amycolatopsis anabasis]|uniref:glycosyltransferase 87 family protein n=1 Tax=Amycolatopsis anabasis TaxID=1840409 RepID=UPI00131E92E6|nr:glycosyltransferase 87 family protein [Amycolatopsis anabasis]